MKKYFAALRKCVLFDQIEDEDLLKMLYCLGARVEVFDKKYTIMSEGNPAKYIGIVLSGSAQITQTDYYGNRSIFGNVEVSEVFAEAFACAESRCVPITVTANEPCEIMFIDCRHVLRICSHNCKFHGQLIYNFMKDLANKTIMFHQKLEIISKRSTREKLLAYLMIQAKKAGSGSFDIPFDRQELADYLEVDRSGLSAEIGKLKKEGILVSDRKHFELL